MSEGQPSQPEQPQPATQMRRSSQSTRLSQTSIEQAIATLTANVTAQGEFMLQLAQQLPTMQQQLATLAQHAQPQVQTRQEAVDPNDASELASEAIALPKSIKLEKPVTFAGEMDGNTVQTFIHKLDMYFQLTGLKDVYMRAAFAATLLTDNAYTWFVSNNFRLGAPAGLQWSALKTSLREYFKPPDYDFQCRKSLAQCCQIGSVKAYVRVFRERYTRCANVDQAEAMFRFIDGLQPEMQRFVRLAKPADYHQALAVAEQIGSTWDSTGGQQKQGQKQGQQQRVPIPFSQRQQQGPCKMELGGQQGQQKGGKPSGGSGQQSGSKEKQQQRFIGTCFWCGKQGHKQQDCFKKERGEPKTAFLNFQDGSGSGSGTGEGSGAPSQPQQQQRQQGN